MKRTGLNQSQKYDENYSILPILIIRIKYVSIRCEFN